MELLSSSNVAILSR